MAGGYVRCGSCKALFHTRENLDNSQTTGKPEPSATEAAGSAQPEQPTSGPHTDTTPDFRLGARRDQQDPDSEEITTPPSWESFEETLMSGPFSSDELGPVVLGHHDIDNQNSVGNDVEQAPDEEEDYYESANLPPGQVPSDTPGPIFETTSISDLTSDEPPSGSDSFTEKSPFDEIRFDDERGIDDAEELDSEEPEAESLKLRSLKLRNLKQRSLKLRNLKQRNRKSRNLKLRNLKLRNLKLRNLKSRSLKSRSLKLSSLNPKLRNLKLRSQKPRNLKLRSLKLRSLRPRVLKSLQRNRPGSQN